MGAPQLVQEGVGGLWAGSPPVLGGAQQNCARSHQGRRHGVRSAPSAQPKTEVWRTAAKCGAAPCVEEGTVRRALRFRAGSMAHSIHLAPWAWDRGPRSEERRDDGAGDGQSRRTSGQEVVT